MRILMISTDQSLLEEGSRSRARHVWYASVLDELHIIVFMVRGKRHGSKKHEVGSMSKRGEQISQNVWVYGTNSRSRWFFVFDALRLGHSILLSKSKCYTSRRSDFTSEVGIPTPDSVRTSGLNADSWIVTCQDPFLTSLAGYRIARAAGAKLNIQVHTDFLSSHFRGLSLGNRIRLCIARFVLPKADGIRVVSERIKESLLQVSGFRFQASRVSVLPIFVDMQKLAAASASFDLRKKFPKWGSIVLMISRLAAEKNISLALRVFKKVSEKYSGVGLVIVGTGPLEDRLRRYMRGLGLGTHVSFEGAQSDVVSYYRGADVFLQTSEYEGFGLALAEATAVGVPFVSTDVGIAKKLAGNTVPHSLCPVSDEHCLSEKLSALMSDVALREKVSREVSVNLRKIIPPDAPSYLAAWRASFENL